MPTVYTEVEVDVDLTDFDDDDLLDEIERRGLELETHPGNTRELLTQIWQLRRLGQDYQRELDDLIYAGIGKVL